MCAMPSDDVPTIAGHGVTDVQAAVVSMSARSTDARDAEYIEWHALDHLPEQYRIAGIRAGTRWVSTPACRAARAASTPQLDPVDHVVQYLFGSPLGQSMENFFALGADLRAIGRMPLALPSVELAGYRLDAAVASARVLTGADVLPWRPARGVYLLVENGGSAPVDLVEVPGVAGFWSYLGSASIDPRLTPTTGRRLTVCYLDDEPVATTRRLEVALRPRWERDESVPLLAAPFEAVIPWRWDAILPC